MISFGLIKLIKKHWFRFKLRKASPHDRAELMRNKFYFLGKNVELYTMNFGTEPYLISIHDNAVCASGVRFINHDVSVHRVAYYLGLKRTDIDKVGSIELFENSFVGAYSILMPNCSIGKNSIVAAGSIVTKRIPDGEVWGGIPAKFIMKTEDYARKMVEESKKFTWMTYYKKTSMTQEELIRHQQNFFFGNKA